MNSSGISCSSRVRDVVVYDRGASVTRSIDVSNLPSEGDIDVVVSGLSPFAASVSAAVTGGSRSIAGVSCAVVPESPDAPIPADDAELDAQKIRLAVVRKLLASERRRGQALAELMPSMPLKKGRVPCGAPLGRVRDLLALSGKMSSAVALSDAKVRELTEEAASLEKAMLEQAAAAANLARFQNGNAGGQSSRRTSRASIRLTGEGKVETLVLTYTVRPARWWPAYSAKLTDGGKTAGLSAEAFVVQAAGEDWEGVNLSLSTADMVAGTELPVLDSLRLGRAQPPKKTGFRKPPEALDELFGPWDASKKSLADLKVPDEKDFLKEESVFGENDDDDDDEDSIWDMDDDDDDDDLDEDGCAECEDPDDVVCEEVCDEEPEVRPVRREPPKPKGGFFERAKSAAKSAVRSRMVMESAACCEREMARPCPMPSMMMGAAAGCAPGMMMNGMAMRPPEPPAELDAGSWLDFDGLTLNDPVANRSSRGKLVRAAQDSAAASALSRAISSVENAVAHPLAQSPAGGRGAFDHLIRAEGTPDIPSDGVVHRIPLVSREAPAVQRLVAVPVEDDGVYREAIVTNPFPMPLLGGPLDVSFCGTLLATDQLKPVGPGGEIQLGLGLEERVKAVRNARTQESTRGVLGGDTEMRTQVEITVRSSLPAPVELLLLDRVPVSGTEDAKVTMELEKECVAYNQVDRGRFVRGGIRWKATLAPGEERTFRFAYTIVFSSKMEIEGGNRRD